MFARFSVLILLVCTAAAPLAADEIELIGETADFVSTGADNSLERQRGLFRVTGKSPNRKLVTDNEEINIHSHYRRGSNRLRNYTYTGEMRILDEGGGVGVTFYSKYPRADIYYRLRMFGGGSFHIEPHPDGEYTLTGVTDSGVVPEAGVWYKFKVVVETLRGRTTIKAKVWRAGRREPRAFQINCSDAGENRIKQGKPGVWAMATGRKEWRKLEVETD